MGSFLNEPELRLCRAIAVAAGVVGAALRCSIARAISFVRQQTAVINSIKAHLAEFCIVAPVGCRSVDQPLGKRESSDL